MADHICKICGESKDPTKARFEHRRLGLDEPPEPVLCRCKDPQVMFKSIMKKIDSASSITVIADDMTMETLPHPTTNMVMMEAISEIPTKEVEIRLDPPLAKMMFNKMSSGMLGSVSKRSIVEIGCSWWTGRHLNSNAKVRKRSNGESVVKIQRSRTRIVPGYTLAISDEYGFDGIIKNPIYSAHMTEMRHVMTMSETPVTKPVKVTLISRMYDSGGRTSYASEFELEGEMTNEIVRRVVSMSMGMVGSATTMRRVMDDRFMSEVRSADHVVVDVPNMRGYKGRYMAKADGVKVYVMSYTFGYVVTMTDPTLTVVSCMVPITNDDLPEMTNKPDVVVAEMLADGSLVFIGVLARGGTRCSISTWVSPPRSLDQVMPIFVYRRSWDKMPSPLELKLEPTPNDGVVLVNEFRTMRLKEPTLDLLYADGQLHMSDGGIMIQVAAGDPNMDQDTVYEMDVVTNAAGVVSLVRPRPRVAKKMPNSVDVVKRAIASSVKDEMVDGPLLDMTSMSFAMRERVYTMAHAKASRNKKVVVTFGIGRFQEWREMMTSGMSYIAIDPNISLEMITKKAKRMTVMEYDFTTPFNTQVLSISKRGSTVLWAKCKSEYFIDRVMPSRIMAMAGVPAVFSFSISYHITVVNRLVSEGVSVFGCGFVHDSMPPGGVGSGSITMKPKSTTRTSGSDIIATFGKSTYIEPYLSRSSVRGLFLVKDEMPVLWRGVDENTVEIMERAVIMFVS